MKTHHMNQQSKSARRMMRPGVLPKDVSGIAITGSIKNDTVDVVNVGQSSVAEMFSAVENDDTGTIAALLAVKVVVDCRDEKGRTPLMMAAIRGHHASYNLLLSSGASLDTYDAAGVPVIDYVHSFGSMSPEKMRVFHAIMLKSLAMGFARSQSKNINEEEN